MFQYLAKSIHSTKLRHPDKTPKFHKQTKEKWSYNIGSKQGRKEAEKRERWMLLKVNA
jgi:hypothetical protein